MIVSELKNQELLPEKARYLCKHVATVTVADIFVNHLVTSAKLPPDVPAEMNTKTGHEKSGTPVESTMSQQDLSSVGQSSQDSSNTNPFSTELSETSDHQTDSTISNFLKSLSNALTSSLSTEILKAKECLWVSLIYLLQNKLCNKAVYNNGLFYFKTL